MKKFIALIMFSLVSVMPMLAQPQREGGRPHFNPEEFKNRMESFIREKVGLTQAEGEKLFPLFYEMKGKQMNINRAIAKLKRNPSGNGAGTTNYSSVVSKIVSLNVELSKVQQTYYNKMCKVVDAKKVFDLMLAEDAFHREMLRKAGPRDGKPNR